MKKTSRAEFLEMMEGIVPWREWEERIKPYYPAGERGRPPKGIGFMLRMYLLQIWFNLSDEGTEDALSDSIAMRKFAGMGEDDESPDATTLLRFRRLLEKHELGKGMFEELNRILEEKGYLLRGGTIMDATIIRASSSTKNRERKRDPEMKSTKKGKNYYFGMKCHIGADAFSGLTHTIKVTAANAADVTVASELPRPDDRVAYGDAGYIGIEKRKEIREDEKLSRIEYRINRRRRSLPKVSDKAIDWERKMERMKSSVRCKVEFPFRVVKRIFGFRKAVYRGLRKNENRLYMLFASSNLYALALAGRTLSPV